MPQSSHNSATITIDRIDHLVLTVADIERTLAFYADVLGMTPVSFGEGRRALAFGDQKLNLHQAGREIDPKAAKPTPGSADLCFITVTPLTAVVAHLERLGILIEVGPVEKAGAIGSIHSVYIRDPDGNLVEISVYGEDD
jgi:catechol 2,3-dioxygenase-like lactoylglutathione lyase family enzyme